MPPKRALIIDDGATSAALSGCRALGADGWRVGIGSPDRSTLARSSRYVDDWHPVPLPEDNPEAFVSAVEKACTAGYEVVFGVSDAQVLMLSKHRDRFAALVPYAPHEVVIRSFDKFEIVEAARSVGLSAPKTEMATSDAFDTFTYPAVVKARLQWSERPGSPRLHTAIVSGPVEASRVAMAMRQSGGEPLLQERIAGELMAVSLVADTQGTILGLLQQHSPHIYPVDNGSSARAVADAIDPDLAEKVKRLIFDLGWTGMVQLQFLRSSDDEPFLIDLNGRFYGSMPLAGASGCGLAAAWAATVTERGSGPLPAPRIGTRFQSLDSDLRRAFEVREEGLVRAVVDCLRFAPGAVHCHWSNRDPLPGIRMFLRLVGRGARKIFRLWSPKSSTN